MKNLFILLFSIVLFSSCSSEDAEGSAKKSLQGKWSWTGSTGGIAGTTDTPKTTNKEMYVEFSGSVYKTYIDGKLATENTFTIKTQKSIFGGEKSMIVSTDPLNYFTPMSFEFKEDKLYLNQECYDCYGSGYIRIK